MLGPPADVTPARLFRLLTQRPRPELPLAYRLRAAPEIPLRVRALRRGEALAAGDVAEDFSALPGVRAAHEAFGLVAAALLLPSGPAFDSAEQVSALLSEAEAIDLVRHVGAALARCSPIHGRCDSDAWGARLRLGAKDPSNVYDAAMLGGCVDIAVGAGMRVVSMRPDRYFGLPFSELTDGQCMAAQAARAVVLEHEQAKG